MGAVSDLPEGFVCSPCPAVLPEASRGWDRDIAQSYVWRQPLPSGVADGVDFFGTDLQFNGMSTLQIIHNNILYMNLRPNKIRFSFFNFEDTAKMLGIKTEAPTFEDIFPGYTGAPLRLYLESSIRICAPIVFPGKHLFLNRFITQAFDEGWHKDGTPVMNINCGPTNTFVAPDIDFKRGIAWEPPEGTSRELRPGDRCLLGHPHESPPVLECDNKPYRLFDGFTLAPGQ